MNFYLRDNNSTLTFLKGKSMTASPPSISNKTEVDFAYTQITSEVNWFQLFEFII